MVARQGTRTFLPNLLNTLGYRYFRANDRKLFINILAPVVVNGDYRTLLLCDKFLLARKL